MSSAVGLSTWTLLVPNTCIRCPMAPAAIRNAAEKFTREAKKKSKTPALDDAHCRSKATGRLSSAHMHRITCIRAAINAWHRLPVPDMCCAVVHASRSTCDPCAIRLMPLDRWPRWEHCSGSERTRGPDRPHREKNSCKYRYRYRARRASLPAASSCIMDDSIGTQRDGQGRYRVHARNRMLLGG
ncbi:hypothetical protein GGI42DRAFT_320005, partial [Trichoderma sp. SZMC 28013]